MAKVSKGIPRANLIYAIPMHHQLGSPKPLIPVFTEKVMVTQPGLKVLFVNQDKSALDENVKQLKRMGIEASAASATTIVINQIIKGDINCIVIDWDLHVEETYKLIAEIVKLNYTGSIIIVGFGMISSHHIKLLDAGADACLAKPCNVNELIARIKSLYNLRTANTHGILEFNELKIDKNERRFFINGVNVFLTKTEFELIEMLMVNKNKILTRDELIANSWNEKNNLEQYSVALYSHIKNVKKKIAEFKGNDYIQTVYGIGYQFSDKKMS